MAASAPEAGAVAAAPEASAVKEVEAVPRRRRVELQVNGVTSPEAFRILLGYVYGVGAGAAWEYCPSSPAVNRDVLRLAKHFDLMQLHERAARWLTENLTTANVVERLVTCEEFDLGKLREKIMIELASSPMALQVVSGSVEIMRHPRILQDLLVQLAHSNTRRVAPMAPVAEAPSPAPETPAEKAPEANNASNAEGKQPSPKEAEKAPSPYPDVEKAETEEPSPKVPSPKVPSPKKPREEAPAPAAPTSKRAAEKVVAEKPVVKRRRGAAGA